MRRARVFVAAPLREDFGIAPLEALADGCRLVTTPVTRAVSGAGARPQLDPRLVSDDLAPRAARRARRPGAGYAAARAELLQPFTPAAVAAHARPSACSPVCCQDGGGVTLLGLHPQPASNGFNIGPLFFHAYGIAYVFAVAAAILDLALGLAAPGRRSRPSLRGRDVGVPGRPDRRPHLLPDHDPSQVPDHWWGVFAIWQGGLGIWGGIAGGAAVGLWVLHRRLGRADLRRFMDVVAPGLLVAQAIGRIGNYFNQELFGAPPHAAMGAADLARSSPAGLPALPTFEPTFLYEMIWNLLVAAFLIWLGQRRHVRPPGVFALYVAGYSGFRIFEETQRIDYSNYFLGLRLNFCVALVLCLLGLTWFVAIQRGWRGSGGPRTSRRPRQPREAGRASPGRAKRRPAAASRRARSGAREARRAVGCAAAGRLRPADAAPPARPTAGCWRSRPAPSHARRAVATP